MLDAKLVVVGGEIHAKEFRLDLPATIGRGRESDIVIGHPLVSRSHCELYEENGKLMVRDLASLNGTFVGRDPVHRKQLKPGELLTVGTVTFRAVYNDWSEGVDEECVVSSQPVDGNDEDTTVMASDLTGDDTKKLGPQRTTSAKPLPVAAADAVDRGEFDVSPKAASAPVKTPAR
jgi:pSer/pThr/pTyr-binding forkhead associated (FHA) protein